MMVRVIACVWLLAACTIPIMPAERMHIASVRDGRHHHYEKGGVTPLGFTCGEQFHRMVAGVAPAEILMDQCEASTTAYGWLMSGFVALPLAGIGAYELDGSRHQALWTTGVALGAVSFAVGLVMGYRALTELNASVRTYNAAAD